MKGIIFFIFLAVLTFSCNSKKAATHASGNINNSIEKSPETQDLGEEVFEIADPEITKVVYEIASFKSPENAAQLLGKSCNKCLAEVIVLEISSYGQEYDHSISEGETAILFFDVEENTVQLSTLNVGDKILTKLVKQRNFYICYAYEKIE